MIQRGIHYWLEKGLDVLSPNAGFHQIVKTLWREFVWLSLLLSGDWLNLYIKQAGLSLLGSDMIVCLDWSYLGRNFWFISKFTIAYILSSCLKVRLFQGVRCLFPCSYEINGLFLCSTKIKIIFPMFPVPEIWFVSLLLFVFDIYSLVPLN